MFHLCSAIKYHQRLYCNPANGGKKSVLVPDDQKFRNFKAMGAWHIPHLRSAKGYFRENNTYHIYRYLP